MVIVGLDLSLTSTGIARLDTHGTELFTAALKPGDRRDWARRDWILDAINEHLDGAVLAVVEGIAYGARFGKPHERAGLWWLVANRVRHRGLELATAAPKSVKAYATDNGDATKKQMVAAARRSFPLFDGGNDEADALWLAEMGAHRFNRPRAIYPAARPKALDRVTWPTNLAGERS